MIDRVYGLLIEGSMKLEQDDKKHIENRIVCTFLRV